MIGHLKKSERTTCEPVDMKQAKLFYSYLCNGLKWVRRDCFCLVLGVGDVYSFGQEKPLPNINRSQEYPREGGCIIMAIYNQETGIMNVTFYNRNTRLDFPENILKRGKTKPHVLESDY